MKGTFLDEIAAKIPEMELSDLRSLELMVKVALQMRSQGMLTNDVEEGAGRSEEGPGVNDLALGILSDPVTYELTLADQALLASLVLSESYQQEQFSSRDINDIISESGRSRVVHITSALTGLQQRSYLNGTTKALRLSREGRAKARALVGMLCREHGVPEGDFGGPPLRVVSGQ
jgi:hypothetical protein